MTQAARDRLFLLVSGAVVAAAVATGLFRLGPPKQQREIAQDQARISNLLQIAQTIQGRHLRGPIPASLSALRESAPYLQVADPLTSEPYEYRVIDESHYTLCAVFQRPSGEAFDRPQTGAPPAFWNHPAGRYCFPFDASVAVPFTRFNR